MKKIVGCLVCLVCVLGLANPAQAQLFRRNNVKVVVRQPAVQTVQVQHVQKVQVQKVQVQKVQVVEQVRVQKVVQQVVQPVYAVQAIQVQPVQAYYRVQQPLAFSSGYDCGQTQALRSEIELLKLQVQKQGLQQQLIMPPAK